MEEGVSEKAERCEDRVVIMTGTCCEVERHPEDTETKFVMGFIPLVISETLT